MPTATATIQNSELFVNDGLLKQSQIGQLKASDPSEPLEVLRERYNTDGYLFLKHLLPREAVLDGRASYFDAMSVTGLLEPGTEPVEGIFNKSANPRDYPNIGAGAAENGRLGTSTKSAEFEDLSVKAHTDEWYIGSEDGKLQGFVNNPILKAFVAKFTGWGEDTLSLKRTLLRNNCPTNRAIGVHYDQVFLRHGEPTSVTAWVPMGDIGLTGGGLIYLEGGNELGAEIEQDFAKKAIAGGMTEEEMKFAFNKNMMSTGFLCEGPGEFSSRHGKKWLVTAYEAGDVVLHKPHQIHASTINNDSEGKIRLGTDLRYVNSARKFDERWLNHFHFNDGL
ncbi:hypothetical protein FSARC_14540 [Fusarium sarcochroum]|uniref:Phytanoyl-CoA hydroxylase n=1 Tax=Fusarium sarcochroum TaxID=1208366 RepID=A0A8H4SSZ4_9HYPO|nr:hypothetical protein FSARC_14540 [Fusarium sarcochroum]